MSALVSANYAAQLGQNPARLNIPTLLVPTASATFGRVDCPTSPNGLEQDSEFPDASGGSSDTISFFANS